METIAKTAYYHIRVDQEKNRIYLEIIGFWKSVDVAPHFHQDIHKTFSRLKPGFTVLADLTSMKPSPPEVKKLHEDTQKMGVKAGLYKAAEVIPEDSVVQIQLDDFGQKSHITRRVFYSRQEAEQWLDQSEN